MVCSKKFGFGLLFGRRHHCRACGNVFCGNCTEFIPLVRYDIKESVRTCIPCYEKEKGYLEKDERKKVKESRS